MNVNDSAETDTLILAPDYPDDALERAAAGVAPVSLPIGSTACGLNSKPGTSACSAHPLNFAKIVKGRFTAI